jgi:hypothetical protein
MKVPHHFGKKQFKTLQVVVSSDTIKHEIAEGNTWISLDSLTVPGRDLSAGKFGFFIHGNDEMALSNFVHYGAIRAKQP